MKLKKVYSKNKLLFFISLLILLVSFFSVDQWSPIKLSNFPVRLVVWSSIIGLIIILRKQLIEERDSRNYLVLKLYILWTLVCVLRGLTSFVGFIELRHWFAGSFACVLPLFLVLFNKAYIIAYINRFWFKWGLFAFFLFFFWMVGFSQSYLSPLLLLFCFFPLFPKKKAFFILCLGVAYCYEAGFENRAQLLKGLMALCVGFAAYYADQIPCKLYKLGHFLGYSSLILVFSLILVDFWGLVSRKESPNEVNLSTDNIMVDSRSLLYLDVMESSLKHGYVLWGRTPARGHDIIYSASLFYREDDDLNDFSRNERHFDEMLFPNIYTWEGLIGVLLLSLVYLKATCLAVYRSRNNYIKLLGCFIAFRWTVGWIEDCSEFNILSISLWCMIGMCYSSQLRAMNGEQFKQWVRTLF